MRIHATLVATMLTLAVASPSLAQTVGGSYSVSGVNINGSTYTGTAQITAVGSTCHITWQTGSTSSAGVCMLANKAFAASYRLGDDNGLVIYELHPDGSLHGWWTIVDKQGVGTETLTPR